ncbi:MAG: T9SS type A sorting domain-containing protein [Candidatus Krumholzibacteriota bacterium]|nr:T9SS type A sorting domain-containing protein [Candidatus Krumholzibacteriota bacterium]
MHDQKMRIMIFKRIKIFLYLPVILIVLIHGGNIHSIEKITTFPGEYQNDQFGISVSTAGDFNGDGYIDLVVGANLEDSGGDAAGRCYLYLGGMTPDSIPDMTFTGSTADRLGTRVAGGGDINNDGYDDIAVYASGSSGDPGEVYIFLGGCSLDGVPDAVLTGTKSGDRFGRGMSINGDINGDGCSDLIIGASEADSSGTVYIYFGGNPFDTDEDITINGENTGDFFGDMVDAGGDVNGDGEDDLLIGAPRNDDGAVWGGKAYLYLGGAAFDTIPDASMTGASIGDWFGAAGKIVRDLNADSMDEMIVSAPYFNNIYGDDAGIIYLFLGASNPDGIQDGTIPGGSYEEQLGYSLSCTDADGDGIEDIIAGAPGYGGAGVQFGRVYLFKGEYPLSSSPLFTYQSADTLGELGISVAGLRHFTRHDGGGGSFTAGGWNIGGTGTASLFGEEIIVTDSDTAEEISKQVVDIYPNPASSDLKIRCTLAKRDEVRMAIYDVTGRKITDIAEGVYGKGALIRSWNPRNNGENPLSRGVYFVVVRIGERAFTRKLLIMK